MSLLSAFEMIYESGVVSCALEVGLASLDIISIYGWLGRKINILWSALVIIHLLCFILSFTASKTDVMEEY